MFLIYNIISTIASIFALPYLLAKATVRERYRFGLARKLGLVVDPGLSRLSKERPIWVHAVSVGEVMAAVPLIRRMKREHPHLKIVLSTVTATGRKTAERNLPELDALTFFPFDLYWPIQRAIRLINPRLFITLETELWPNLLMTLNRRGIPALLVNGRISDSSFKGYRMFQPLFRRALSAFSYLCMQSEADADRILAIGADPAQVLVTGNMKYDGAWEEVGPEAGKYALHLLGLEEGARPFIAGSTHRGEEEAVLSVFLGLKEHHPDLILVIAPRHPERFNEVANLVSSRGIKLVRRTEIDGHHGADVILLDTIGELSRLYAGASIIFIGGSLIPFGGHNPLEAAVYGKPVLFGPHMENFRDIAEGLIKGGGAFRVASPSELYSRASALLTDGQLLEGVGRRAEEVVKRNRGACEATMRVVNEVLNAS